jgi:hypothetical protein
MEDRAAPHPEPLSGGDLRRLGHVPADATDAEVRVARAKLLPGAVVRKDAPAQDPSPAPEGAD